MTLKLNKNLIQQSCLALKVVYTFDFFFDNKSRASCLSLSVPSKSRSTCIKRRAVSSLSKDEKLLADKYSSDVIERASPSLKRLRQLKNVTMEGHLRYSVRLLLFNFNIAL